MLRGVEGSLPSNVTFPVRMLRLRTIVRYALGRASLGMTGLKKLVSISALLRSFSFGIGP
jgi:hypothetical protein